MSVVIINQNERALEVHKQASQNLVQSSAETQVKEHSDLKKAYNEFVNQTPLTEIQNKIFHNFISLIQTIEASIKINFEYSIENEIVVSQRTNHSVNIFVIDEDGDIIINHVPLEGESWSEFFNYGERLDFEYMIYRFLS